MNTTLTVVTLVALAVAAVATSVAWRVFRQEQRRSRARVARLSAEIRRIDSPTPEQTERAALANLFGAAPESAVGLEWTTALLGFGAAAGIAAMLMMGSRQPASVEQTGATPNGRSRAGVGASAPLQLVSLEHAQTDDRLVVRGVVRNPAGGIDVGHLTAVVLLFSQGGSYMTSGRTMVETGNLAAGAQASFAIIVPGATDVGKYRVSFRTDEGILPHVDQRESQDRALKSQRSDPEGPGTVKLSALESKHPRTQAP